MASAGEILGTQPGIIESLDPRVRDIGTSMERSRGVIFRSQKMMFLSGSSAVPTAKRIRIRPWFKEKRLYHACLRCKNLSVLRRRIFSKAGLIVPALKWTTGVSLSRLGAVADKQEKRTSSRSRCNALEGASKAAM